MDLNNDQKVCWADLQATLGLLNHSVPRKDVESMLWEVDDDAKGYLNAADFKASYYRIRASKDKHEPRGWFRCHSQSPGAEAQQTPLCCCSIVNPLYLELIPHSAWSRLVEFMMIDEDGDGTIAFDEAAKMFRNRYGAPTN